MIQNELLREFADSQELALAKKMAESFDSAVNLSEDAQVDALKQMLETILQERLNETC